MTDKLRVYFWIALLAHLLLYLSFSLVIHFNPPEMKMEPPIETYIYHEEKNNPVSHPIVEQPTKKQTPISDNGIQKPVPQTQPVTKQVSSESVSLGKGEQNINLKIKSKNAVDKPLLDNLTKSIARHLKYPKIAVDFHLTGTVILGFSISPDGQINNIRVLHSSGTEVLDNAAVTAITAASPLKNVKPYLNEPEDFSFKILFEG